MFWQIRFSAGFLEPEVGLVELVATSLPQDGVGCSSFVKIDCTPHLRLNSSTIHIVSDEPWSVQTVSSSLTTQHCCASRGSLMLKALMLPSMPGVGGQAKPQTLQLCSMSPSKRWLVGFVQNPLPVPRKAGRQSQYGHVSSQVRDSSSIRGAEQGK